MYKTILIMCVFSLAIAQQPRPWSQAAPIAWGPPTDGWQLAAFTERQGYTTDEAVLVALAVRNLAGSRLSTMVPKSPWEAAEFTVRRQSDGKIVDPRPPKSTLERLERHAHGASKMNVELGTIGHLGVVN